MEIVYNPNFPENYRGNVLAESNLPYAVDDLSIGDAAINRWFARPADYLWRSPQLDTVKAEAKQLNKGMTFQSFDAPTLNSFAAFAQESTSPGIPVAGGGATSPGIPVAGGGATSPGIPVERRRRLQKRCNAAGFYGYDDMNFACTLNSFGAFAQDPHILPDDSAIFSDVPASPDMSSVQGQDISAPATDYLHSSPIGDVFNPDAGYTSGPTYTIPGAAPATRQNPILDAISGLIRTTGAAAAQRIAPGQTAAQRAAAARTAAGGGISPAIIIGGIGLIALIAFANK